MHSLIGERVGVVYVGEGGRLYESIGVVKKVEGNLVFLTDVGVHRSVSDPTIGEQIVNTTSTGFLKFIILKEK